MRLMCPQGNRCGDSAIWHWLLLRAWPQRCEIASNREPHTRRGHPNGRPYRPIPVTALPETQARRFANDATLNAPRPLRFTAATR